MKRILVIGSAGAGKSVFAKRLAEKLGLPLIHLDQEYWKPGWVKPERLEWEAKVRELIARESWVMDGNYRSTLSIRIPAADTIILLDFSRFICFWRIWKRRLKDDRKDVLPGSPEQVSWNLVRWVLWRYPQYARKDMLERLKEIRADQKLIILRSQKELETFLKELRN